MPQKNRAQLCAINSCHKNAFDSGMCSTGFTEIFPKTTGTVVVTKRRSYRQSSNLRRLGESLAITSVASTDPRMLTRKESCSTALQMRYAPQYYQNCLFYHNNPCAPSTANSQPNEAKNARPTRGLGQHGICSQVKVCALLEATPRAPFVIPVQRVPNAPNNFPSCHCPRTAPLPFWPAISFTDRNKKFLSSLAMTIAHPALCWNNRTPICWGYSTVKTGFGHKLHLLQIKALQLWKKKKKSQQCTPSRNYRPLPYTHLLSLWPRQNSLQR